ncbi:MAG: hypothetical protein HY814_12930, partial [Candidatus Riflebacteria bacterium]|nr:hypothetical protein [Candidatus Riflebacteria bacterium]
MRGIRRFRWALLAASSLLALQLRAQMPPPPGMDVTAATTANLQDLLLTTAPVLVPPPAPRPVFETSPALARAFSLFDADRDGRLSRDEGRRFLASPDDLWPDPDGDGWSSRAELHLAVSTQNPAESVFYDEDLTGLLAQGARAFGQKELREA